MDDRKILWQELLNFNQNSPWLVGGDFNAILNNEEKLGGAPVSDTDTIDFQNFFSFSNLVHLKAIGNFYTWCNKQDAQDRIWSRLDRVLVNEDWIHQYTSSPVEFLMPSCSDHSPALITIGEDKFDGKRPFRFFNMRIKHPKFLPPVKSVWEQNISGYNMYKFHTKLKFLKPVLKELNKKHFMNISEQVIRAKDELSDIQKQMAADLLNSNLIAKEKEGIKKYIRLLNCEYSFYKQKTNISWSLHGDKCTQFFHSFMKNKRHRNRVLSIYTEDGKRITDMPSIIEEFTDYYKKILGTAITVTNPDHH
ncbi:uncharacterized protein LOC109842442 [Asparagus officinalis]|uniref:uncharacterized protein LOC109842442 n=1 Tax=Asparagus officinalis TaxID=4686 RepID=UPI00098E3BD1|nr:uncharacterized protein LOC109842442 [Asparagus officinalis]